MMESLDFTDIRNKMNLLKPDNMFITFISPQLKKELEANPDKFKVEHFYQKEFTVQLITDD